MEVTTSPSPERPDLHHQTPRFVLPGRREGRSRGAMIAMFLATTFGMMALLSVPLSIPPLDRILAPPVVQVPGGAEAAGPALPLPSWGHPAVIAAPAPPVAARPVGGSIVTHPAQDETPAPPATEPPPKLVVLKPLPGVIVDSTHTRKKALIRSGRGKGGAGHEHTAVRPVHVHAPKDPQRGVGRSHAVHHGGRDGVDHGHGNGHGHERSGNASQRGHDHERSRSRSHAHGNERITRDGPGHDHR